MSMQLFSFEFAQQQIRLEATPWKGDEQLWVDDELVSQKTNFGIASEHNFKLAALGAVKLIYVLNLRDGQVTYELWRGEGEQQERLLEGAETLKLSAEQRANSALYHAGETPSAASAPAVEPTAPAKGFKGSLVAIGLVAFKLLKAVKVIKVALLAASVGVYSIMFTFEFAMALIGVLVFHEYGHLRAMKKFGIPTKGMYLIPFVGGLAVGDRPRSQWQDVYISLMGPVFGLLMTLVFYVVYLLTDSHFAGLVASTSALINLFNLIPVHPLDGGRVIKALVFSAGNYLAFIGLLVLSALCFVIALKLGLYFITFFIVLGVVDIVGSWREAKLAALPPLNRYGIAYCTAWYLAVVGLFIGLILMIASDGLPGSEIAIKVLQS
jgi:putative peptide zinc metalloprotease protein